MKIIHHRLYRDDDVAYPFILSPNISDELQPEFLEKQRIFIPVNLAISNRDQEDLEVVRVELSYDSKFEITSSGKTKIDPDGKRLIYEHEIGTLSNVDNFTPIQSVDVIAVPYSFSVIHTIVRTNDGVPLYLVTLAGYDKEKVKW